MKFTLDFDDGANRYLMTCSRNSNLAVTWAVAQNATVADTTGVGKPAAAA